MARCLFLLVAVCHISGCMTAKTIEGLGKSVGSEVSKGNYLTAGFLGLWGGTVGLTVALTIDAVTLGGALTAEEAASGMRAASSASSSGASRDKVVTAYVTGGGDSPPSRENAATDEMGSIVGTGTGASTGNDSRRTNIAAAGPGARILPSSGSGCKTTLAHLSPRLSDYPVAELQRVRSALLAEDLVEALARARSMGYTPASAAAESLKAARAAEGEAERGKACVRAFAPDSTVTALEEGRFRFSGRRISELSINEACAAQYIILRNTATSLRESAVQMACLAR